MPSYSDATDGLFISTVPTVFNIPAVRGSIFYALGGSYRDGTRTLWPTGQRNRTQNWVLRDTHFREGQVLPLTRDLVLGYLEYRPVTASTGDLMVSLDGDPGLLVCGADALHPDGGPVDTSTGEWAFIDSVEAGALATYAARWWANDGIPPTPPSAFEPDPGSVERFGTEGIRVSREWDEPDESRAEHVSEVTEDGHVVRTIRVPVVHRDEVYAYVRRSWVEHVLERAGNAHSVSGSTTRLLSGEEVEEGLSWDTVPLARYEGDEWVALEGVERLAVAAGAKYGWCATARRVMDYIGQADSRPRYQVTIRLPDRATPSPSWLREEYLSAQTFTCAETAEQAAQQALQTYSEFSGIPVEALGNPSVERSASDYSREYRVVS